MSHSYFPTSLNIILSTGFFSISLTVVQSAEIYFLVMPF